MPNMPDCNETLRELEQFLDGCGGRGAKCGERAHRSGLHEERVGQRLEDLHQLACVACEIGLRTTGMAGEGGGG